MKALITGGAGFIGSNLSLRLVKEGYNVTIFDNFSRIGSLDNLKILQKAVPKSKLNIVKGDVRDYQKVLSVSKVDVIFHLAAQTAVTTSVAEPRSDMDTNINGTFNVLEAARSQKNKPIVVYSSTNKVYGSLEWMKNFTPVSEKTNLDFHSPYGVSKGSADSYVKDYWRIYGVPTVVFRQSCIYGPMQLGVEDQGWVAHMAAKALLGEKINIFGDGTQIRDLLFVEDLIDAYLLAVKNIKKVCGEVFNIGGGENNAISVNEYLKFLEKKLYKEIKLGYFGIRPGDQKYFVSDNTNIKNILAWSPKTQYSVGLLVMIDWIWQNRELFKKINGSGQKK